MKRKDLCHGRQSSIFRIKMSKDLHQKPTAGRNIGTDRFIRTGGKDILKKAQDFLFHIKGKLSLIKWKGRKPQKALGRKSLLRADDAEKFLDVFAVVVNLFPDLFYLI